MIVLGTTISEKIIDFINGGRPRKSIVQRKAYIQDLLLWRTYRRIILEEFGIPFRAYTAYRKKLRSILED